MGEDEEIVLLDPAGTAIGTAPKAASHHEDTPFHLAFSCYLVDDEGRVLITQRAHHKATFPSVWSNSCCGHPGPGEGLRQAVLRRLEVELGVRAEDLTLLLPEFSYRAQMGGIIEHEWCPVVRARHHAPETAPVRPNPDEVADIRWQSWQECLDLARRPESSPWFRSQVALLAPFGGPADWPAAEPSRLPPAITW